MDLISGSYERARAEAHRGKTCIGNEPGRETSGLAKRVAGWTRGQQGGALEKIPAPVGATRLAGEVARAAARHKFLRSASLISPICAGDTPFWLWDAAR